MYITENQNIGESVLFMLSARNSLSEMVEDSGHDNSDVMVNFLMNEATDYEIINLLVSGKLPDENYNAVAESYLFSALKEQVLRQSETFSEMIGEKTFNDFLTKVDSLYPNVSTAGPMLEFFSAQNPQISGAMLLSERPSLASVAAKKSFAKFGQKGQKGGESSGQTDSPDMPFTRTPMPAEPSQLMRHAKDFKAGAEDKAAEVGKAVSDKAGEVGKAVSDKASEVGGAISKFATGEHGPTVGAAAAAALLTYAAAKTYKRFFSKAAGACRGMGGGAKTDCMNKYRGRALMAQAGELQRGMQSCSKSKNPAGCKSAVSGKIDRLKAKAKKIAV